MRICVDVEGLEVQRNRSGPRVNCRQCFGIDVGVSVPKRAVKSSLQQKVRLQPRTMVGLIAGHALCFCSWSDFAQKPTHRPLHSCHY